MLKHHLNFFIKLKIDFTIMLKILRTLPLISFLSLVILVMACNDDDEKPNDVLTPLVGDHEYELDVYIKNPDNSLTWAPGFYHEGGSAVLERTTGGFKLSTDGRVLFTASNVVTVQEGFTFDIAPQTIKIEGRDTPVTGFPGKPLNGTKYHGMYVNTFKTITGYVQYEGSKTNPDGTTVPVNYIAVIESHRPD
jgi:hypothetical protein